MRVPSLSVSVSTTPPGDAFSVQPDPVSLTLVLIPVARPPVPREEP